jgi:hypothetical protein
VKRRGKFKYHVVKLPGCIIICKKILPVKANLKKDYCLPHLVSSKQTNTSDFYFDEEGRIGKV